jgi:peptidoglycan/LPS O-acetylase OafA/YrhL
VRQTRKTAGMTNMHAAPLVAPRHDDIDPGVSSYLDVLRTGAAVTVLFNHYFPYLFNIDERFIPGHDAVIVFFVMSGYVIAYVAGQRDRPADRFVINRVARLWSVLIPSLVLSVLAALIVGDRSVAVPAPAVTAPWAFSVAALKTVLFLGESWGGDTPAPYNAATWSINYEAWYYAVFAAFVFAAARWRWRLAGAIAVLAGPRVMALFPCWLLGVWLFNRRTALVMRPGAAYALFAAAAALYALAYHIGLTTESRQWLKALTHGESYHLGPSTSVIGDMLLAPVIAASIVAVQNMPAVNRVLARAAPITRIAASRTLSLYLFHVPLFAILYGGFGLGQHGGIGSVLCLLLGIGGAVALGGVTEARLTAWRAWLGWLHVRCRRYLAPAAGVVTPTRLR